jgi:hypothetical protein
MRWVAAILWAVSGVPYVLSELNSAVDPGILTFGPVFILLATAFLIAVGGRLGLGAATLGAGVAGFATLGFAVLALLGCVSGCPGNLWLWSIGAAVFTLVSVLAVREIKRTLSLE